MLQLLHQPDTKLIAAAPHHWQQLEPRPGDQRLQWQNSFFKSTQRRLQRARNWQELTTSEPSGLDKVASSVASKWHLAAPTRNPTPSRLPPGISNTNPNISTIDQRLIRFPEEVADCGQNHWISLMPIKCKKSTNQTSPSDAVHALMPRLCCTTKYPTCVKLAQCHTVSVE